MPVDSHLVPRPVRTILVHWLLPPDPWIKLNTDGSYDQHTGVAFSKGLIWGHLGALHLAFHTPLVVTSSFDVELQTLLPGLYLTRRFDALVWIELDSLVVVHLLQTDHSGPWQGNRPADYMARLGVTSSALHLLSAHTPPRYFLILVRMDQILLVVIHSLLCSTFLPLGFSPTMSGATCTDTYVQLLSPLSIFGKVVGVGLFDI
ncbi:hypothetical protein ACS0TY_027372 [Phlomoides rotata]